MPRAKIIFADRNLVTPLATLTSSSANPRKPAAYTASDFRGVHTHATGKTEEYYQVAWSSAQTFNCFAVIDSNLSDTGTVALLGSDDNFATSEEIWPASTLPGNPGFFTLDLKSFLAVRVVYRDPDNAASYIDFGKLFVGTYFQPEQNFAYNWSQPPVDLSTRMESINNVPHFNEKAIRRQPDLSFVKVPEADADLVDALALRVGTSRPFIVALDHDNRKDQTYYVRFADLPAPSNVTHERYTWPLRLVEAI